MDAKKLPITGPCPVDFDRSTFDHGAARRFCDHCQKSVHNLSAMSRSEARDFLRENAGKKLCVTYKHDKGGAIAFKKSSPPPTPADIVPAASLVRHRRPGRSLPVVQGRPATAAPRTATFGLAAALAACTPHTQSENEPEPETAPIVIIEPELEPEPEPEMLAGAVAIPEVEPEIPEPQIEVEGEMMMPMGDVAIPDDGDPQPEVDPVVVEPCDTPEPEAAPPVLPYQPKVEPPPTTPDDIHNSVRGRIAVPDPKTAG